MNKEIVLKLFTYLLIYLTIVAVVYLIGAFIAQSWNLFEWWLWCVTGRVIILIFLMFNTFWSYLAFTEIEEIFEL